MAASIKNNSQAGLTGALVFSGRFFVQVLEGSDSFLDALLAVLSADARHGQMTIISEAPIVERKFAAWRMAYVGPSIFVDRQVSRLVANPTEAEILRLVSWLETFLVEHDQTKSVRCQ